MRYALFFMCLARGFATMVRTMDKSVVGEEGVGIFKATRRCADAN